MRAAKILLLLTVLSAVLFLAAAPVPRVPISIATTPVYLSSGKRLLNTHEVVGRVSGRSPIEVQLMGAARFSGAATYFCVVSGADDLQTLGPQVVNVDGTRLRIIHASAEPASVSYRCTGM